MTQELPWKDICESTHDGLGVASRDGVFLWANDSLTRLSGWQGLSGVSINQLLPDHVATSQHASYIEGWFANPTSRVMAHGGSNRILQLKRSNGRLINCDIALAPLKIGEETFCIVSVRDASEDVDKEDRLSEIEALRAQAEKAKEEAESAQAEAEAKVGLYEKRNRAEGRKKLAVVSVWGLLGMLVVVWSTYLITMDKTLLSIAGNITFAILSALTTMAVHYMGASKEQDEG